MAWVIYLGMQELHPGTETWLAEWGHVLNFSSAMNALEEGETANLATLLPQGEMAAYESLGLWLQQHPATHCALVYPQPALVIAQHLQQGEELGAACQRWQQQAQALLTLFRRHRRQLSLLTWPAVATTSEGESGDPVPLPKRSAGHEFEPVYSLLAQQILTQDAELVETARYLAASTYNAAEYQAAGASLSAMLIRHRQEQQQQRQDQKTQAEALEALREGRDQALQMNHDQAEAARQEREEENSLLLEQLHSVQEELEQQLKQTRDQLKAEQTKFADFERERGKVQSELDRANAQRKESEEENTLLLEQLHYVQEELERHILDCQQAHQQQEVLLQWLRAFATRTNRAFYKKRPAVLKEHIDLLTRSASFDADWYARTYPDVAENGIEPAVHYLKFGMLEGRNPSANFDTRHYITAHPDIADAGEHPLLHYIRWGRAEQRPATPPPLAEEVQ